jgi:pSer/pThr/pTyr-binding forkhead associated (FHA) protein
MTRDTMMQDTVIIRSRDRRQASTDAGPALVRPAPEPLPESARYGFRLPHGDERRLDAVYHLGRRPSLPRIADGSTPRLVSIPSNTNAVSATHLEIRQEGDSVVVTDLGSTNGTIVIPPRGRKQRLRSGQSLAVVPGTTVDIGDGNIIEILPVSDR